MTVVAVQPKYCQQDFMSFSFAQKKKNNKNSTLGVEC